MNDYILSQFLNASLNQAKKECQNNVYLLKVETIKKIKIIDDLFEFYHCNINFDAPTNSIEISTTAFVFDSMVCNLKRAFELVDLFVIDSIDDGKVCVQMKILNAAEMIRRN